MAAPLSEFLGRGLLESWSIHQGNCHFRFAPGFIPVVMEWKVGWLPNSRQMKGEDLRSREKRNKGVGAAEASLALRDLWASSLQPISLQPQGEKHKNRKRWGIRGGNEKQKSAPATLEQENQHLPQSWAMSLNTSLERMIRLTYNLATHTWQETQHNAQADIHRHIPKRDVERDSFIIWIICLHNITKPESRWPTQCFVSDFLHLLTQPRKPMYRLKVFFHGMKSTTHLS